VSSARQREATLISILVRDKFRIALRDKRQIDAFLKNPESRELVDATVAWLANGWSPMKISEATGLNIELIRQIRDEHPEAIANIKTTIALRLGETVQLLAERMLANIDRISPDKVPAALAQILDKYQLLSGGMTARVEHKNVASAEDLERMFKALPSAKVVESLPEKSANGDNVR